MKLTRLALTLSATVALASPSMAAEAEETWKSIGNGLFRENFMHAFYNISQYPEVTVEIQESEQTPGRYRIVNPYKDYPDFIGSPGCYPGDYYIVVDASDPVHCYVETSKAGYQCGGNEMLIVGSIADDYYNVRYGDWVLADKENRCGKLVDGAITFPPMSLLASAWNQSMEWDDDISWKLCDEDGMFRLKLPGAPDLDIAADIVGLNDAGTAVTFNVVLGASIERALVAFVPVEESEGAVDKIVSGETASVEITEGGAVDVPYTGDGLYSLIIVPYLDGTPHAAFVKNLELAYSEAEWRKAGKAFYREGIVSGVAEMIPYGFIYPTYEYYVNVEESVETPGLIRLVDPYGDDSPLSSGYSYDHSKHWYLYIDASTPDRVVIKRAEGIGLNLGYGMMEIWSKADRAHNQPDYWAYGWTEEEIEAFGWYGLFQNDEITFPKNALSFHFPQANPGAWYEANSKGEFLLKFEPGQIKGAQSGIESVSADGANGPVEYFRIDGTPASKGSLAPGLYIVRGAGKTHKAIIK